MKRHMSKEDWDKQYAAGKWQFLRNPSEQKRLQLVAQMIAEIAATEGKVTVVDLGSGEGQLYEWLMPEWVEHYVGMDISEVALNGIKENIIPVTRACFSLEDYSHSGSGVRTVYVASEVLTYNENSIEQLRRITQETEQLAGVIISVVGPHPDKPNWTAASKKFWSRMKAISWPKPEVHQVKDPDSGIVWDLAGYRFDQR